MDIPAAMGAAFATKGRVICLAGDGSSMFNLQELQTIRHHNLAIKIIILNNGGYLSMRTTQKNFFAGRLVGEGPMSGVSFPDFVAVGNAFGLKSSKIESLKFSEEIDLFLGDSDQGLVEVILRSRTTF